LISSSPVDSPTRSGPSSADNRWCASCASWRSGAAYTPRPARARAVRLSCVLPLLVGPRCTTAVRGPRWRRGTEGAFTRIHSARASLLRAGRTGAGRRAADEASLAAGRPGPADRAGTRLGPSSRRERALGRPGVGLDMAGTTRTTRTGVPIGRRSRRTPRFEPSRGSTSTSCSRCEDRTVPPWSAKPRSSPRIRRMPAGPRPSARTSRISTSGPPSKAWAILSRCRMPSEERPRRRVAYADCTPTSFSISSTRRAGRSISSGPRAGTSRLVRPLCCAAAAGHRR
jgi:hypothetical protein